MSEIEFLRSRNSSATWAESGNGNGKQEVKAEEDVNGQQKEQLR